MYMYDLCPELHRKIFNILSINDVMKIHKVCKKFKNYQYYSQIIPLVLFDNIFSLHFFDECKEKLRKLFCLWKLNDYRIQYLYCLENELLKMQENYTLWDSIFFKIHYKIVNDKVHEKKMYKQLYKINNRQYNISLKNNLMLRAIIY